MKARIMFAAVFGCVTLLGCHSLNVSTYNVSQVTLSTTHQTTQESNTEVTITERTPAPVAEKKPESRPLVCPIYKPLVLPPLPALPYKELEAAGPGNTDRINEVERKHIEELRQFILKSRAALDAHNQRYLQTCKDYLRGK